MSNYTILTAKKRTETSIRNIHLPTNPTPTSGSDAKNGTLLISLLQSRLNWCNSIFSKYRHDTIQQPRRTNNMRKKWPNMRYLGTCTVHLGVHVFPETTFYEAVRKEPWVQLAKSAGLEEDVTDIPMDIDNSNEGITEKQQPEKEKVDCDNRTEQPQGEQETEKEEPQQQQFEQPPVTSPPPPGTDNDLVFTDLVMEFKENAGERFIFPTEAIVESRYQTAGEYQLIASFLLPLADQQDFFRDANEKVALWGHQSTSATIRNYASTLDIPMGEADPIEQKQEEGGSTSSATPSPQPVNIQLSGVEEPLLGKILSTVQPSEIVRNKMMARLTSLPTRQYLQYYTAMDKTILELLQKASTIPEVVHGPVLAEKKRNELLNDIQLGKRPRTDDELPKSKAANSKDDGLRKCAYCIAKTTSMWRPGPAGQGTLCNACGLMWSQGKILKDAPVISREEEKKRINEERERKREEEEQEKKRQRETQLLELEQQQQPPEQQKQQQVAANARRNSSQNKSAIQTVQTTQQVSLDQQQQEPPSKSSQKQKQKQKQLKQKQSLPSHPIAAATSSSTTGDNVAINSTAAIAPTTIAPATTTASSGTVPIAPAVSKPEPEPEPEARRSIYQTPAGIPLPTLSIDFGPSFLFVHPDCTVVLLENCFSIRLNKEGFEPITMKIDRMQLKCATFEVVVEKQLQQEVLIMTVIPEVGPVIRQFHTDLLIPGDSTKSMKIRFLEKLDEGNVAVVQRILERWLSSPNVVPASSPTPCATAPLTPKKKL